MSRDSRLLHNHLHALAEHLNAGAGQLEETAGRVHAELHEQQTAPPAEVPAPIELELPESSDAAVGD